MLVKPLREKAVALFRNAFAAPPQTAASAPGHLTLLGDHSSLNGGPALAIATAERTIVAAGPGEPGTLEAIASMQERPARIALEEPPPDGLFAPLARVLHELAAHGSFTAGFGARIAIATDLPLVPGAPLAVAAARALSGLGSAPLTPRQLAGIAFRSDANHERVQGGVVGHAVAALARPGTALLVDSASAEARAVPFVGRLLLVDLGLDREPGALVAAERLAECQRAVTRLALELPELIWLASWPAAWVARLKRALPEPLRSRAVHVVGEAARARYGAELLAKRRLRQFGALMYESHESARRLYDHGAPEADTVVRAARRAGAYGARLTGGSVIVLPGKGDAKVVDAIRRAFTRAYAREPVIRTLRASAGARLERPGTARSDPTGPRRRRSPAR